MVLAVPARHALRRAARPATVAWGIAGYGVAIGVGAAGIERTSVSHAALLTGAVPVFVAIMAAVGDRRGFQPTLWTGLAVSCAGFAVLTGTRTSSGNATALGDGLVLASALLGAAFTVAQARLLVGHNAVAVTAVQFAASGIAVVPFAVLAEAAPAAPTTLGAVLGVLWLIVAGTVVPFTLFAVGQRSVTANTAGAFLNVEPLVGAVIGMAAFGDATGPAQWIGSAAALAGMVISTVATRHDTTPGTDLIIATTVNPAVTANRGDTASRPAQRAVPGRDLDERYSLCSAC